METCEPQWTSDHLPTLPYTAAVLHPFSFAYLCISLHHVNPWPWLTFWPGMTTPVALGNSLSCSFAPVARPDKWKNMGRVSEIWEGFVEHSRAASLLHCYILHCSEDAANLGVAGENCRLCGARIQTYLLEKACRRSLFSMTKNVMRADQRASKM